VLPLRDINPKRPAPVATYLLIALNLAVFVYQFIVLTPAQGAHVLQQHAVIPARLLSGYGPSLSTPFTSMFMHAGLMHLAGNMWFLHVFGDNVEDVLGHGWFLAFYLFTGVVSVLAHVLVDPHSHLPLLGASGAISGVLGAYMLMFPKTRVVTFLPPFFLYEIPAFFFLLFWFVLQLFSGIGTLATAQQPGVAFMAHVGGFLAGVFVVLLTGARRKQPVAYLGPRIPTRNMRRRY
jgi:membrane associated rhomboid family serine protease